MDKDYLWEEIIEGLEAVKHSPKCLIKLYENESNNLVESLYQLENELEHIVSCSVALRGWME